MKIMGFDYKIAKDLDTDTLGALGKFQAAPQIINISSGLAKQQHQSTIVHEIIEAINYHNNLELNHQTISTLETALFQVLTDNGVDLSPLEEA